MKATKQKQMACLGSQAQHKPPKRNLKYDAWFALQMGQGIIKKHLKETLKIHMKSYGFFDKNQFDEGLNHFGIKKP